MNQQPDKLFREKLEGFQKPAPASAWDKIETNLDKQNPKGLWWKVAASLLLIAVSAYLLWPKNQPSEKTFAKTNEKVKPLPTLKDEVVSKELPNTIDAPRKLPEAVQKNTVAKIDKEKYQQKQKTQEPAMAMSESVTPHENNWNEVARVTEIIIAQEEVDAKVETITKNSDTYVTLIVTAEEANKYLIKNTITEATSDDIKTSSFRKLLNKASDLTNDQRPLADLRQMKDEILALNFDYKKQREQNKQ